MPALSFAALWEAHPAVQGDLCPCSAEDGTPNFDNQCAIRMGLALERVGYRMDRFRGARCWQGHTPPARHVLRAQELADFLRRGDDTARVEVRRHQAERDAALQEAAAQAPAPAPAQTEDQAEAEARLQAPLPYRGRTGIVFFRNFWGTGNQGDHIDLWNGEAMAHGAPDYFYRAEEVWFWPVL